MIVYHITEAKWAIENIRLKRIKIAELNDLNDPFELLATSSTNKKERKEIKEWKEEVAKITGLLCFSRNWSNPVLWSHYGKKHTGIALGFDVHSDNLEDVIYTSTRIDADSIRGINGPNLEKYIKKCLLMKYTDWAYEDEVRLFTDLKERDTQSGKCFLPFGPELKLREVIAGPLCEATKEELESLAKDYSEKIMLTKARLAFRSFNVVENQQGFNT